MTSQSVGQACAECEECLCLYPGPQEGVIDDGLMESSATTSGGKNNNHNPGCHLPAGGDTTDDSKVTLSTCELY